MGLFQAKLLVCDPDGRADIAMPRLQRKVIEEAEGALWEALDQNDAPVADRMITIDPVVDTPWLALVDSAADPSFTGLSELAKRVSADGTLRAVVALVDDGNLTVLSLFRDGRHADSLVVPMTRSAITVPRAALWLELIPEGRRTELKRAMDGPLEDSLSAVGWALGLSEALDRDEVDCADSLAAVTVHLRKRNAAGAQMPASGGAVAGDLMIPRFLVGSKSLVTKKWATVARRGIAKGSWEEALRSVEFVSLNDVSHPLVVSNAFRFQHSENIYLHGFLATLMKAALLEVPYGDDLHREEERYQKIKSALMDGADQFWFCLGLLGGVVEPFPRNTSYEREHTLISRMLLRKMMKWWPVYCNLAPRFTPLYFKTWVDWGLAPLNLAMDLGVSSEWIENIKALDAEGAGQQLMALAVGAGSTG